MDEKINKQYLIEILKKDFLIHHNLKGNSFYNTGVVPDISATLKSSELFIVIEIKNDEAKNFKWSDLLRQAVNYKYSKYKGLIPNIVLVTTTKMLKGIKPIKSSRMLGLASKLGAGTITEHSIDDGNSKELRFKIGSNVFYI